MTPASNFYDVVGFLAALEQSAIDQHHHVLGFQVIGRAGDVAGCAVKIDFHPGSASAHHKSFPMDDGEARQHRFTFIDLANAAQIKETAKADVAADKRPHSASLR